MITDTLGIQYDSPSYKEVYEEKNLHFVELLGATLNGLNLNSSVELYTQKILRQRDMLSCGIFSLQDLELFAGGRIFDQISFLKSQSLVHKLAKEERIITDSETEIFVLDILPPEYMHSCQNLRILDQYLEASESVCRAGAIETSELSFGCGDTGRKVDASVSKTPSKDPS